MSLNLERKEKRLITHSHLVVGLLQPTDRIKQQKRIFHLIEPKSTYLRHPIKYFSVERNLKSVHVCKCPTIFYERLVLKAWCQDIKLSPDIIACRKRPIRLRCSKIPLSTHRYLYLENKKSCPYQSRTHKSYFF